MERGKEKQDRSCGWGFSVRVWTEHILTIVLKKTDMRKGCVLNQISRISNFRIFPNLVITCIILKLKAEIQNIHEEFWIKFTYWFLNFMAFIESMSLRFSTSLTKRKLQQAYLKMMNLINFLGEISWWESQSVIRLSLNFSFTSKWTKVQKLKIQQQWKKPSEGWKWLCFTDGIYICIYLYLFYLANLAVR